MEPIYLFLHIPRTGGTTLEYAVGHWLDRHNDRYLKHYHYVQNFSDMMYNNKHIPTLVNRTTQQQKQLRILTGHSIFCNSHRWLRVQREPKIFSYIRHPIYRLLSSFNYRHMAASLSQDPISFSCLTPFMNENACHQTKTAQDYETLWEYYNDCNFEHNLQCKWLIKSFCNYNYTNKTWEMHPIYLFGPDARVPVEQAAPITWPEWMFRTPMENVNWYEMAKTFFDKIWWLSRLEMIDDHLEDLCKHMKIEYCETPVQNKSETDTCPKYWTIEDVMKQPDIDKLIEAEKYDFQLYEAAKNWTRPF